MKRHEKALLWTIGLVLLCYVVFIVTLILTA